MHFILSGERPPLIFPYGNYEGDIDSSSWEPSLSKATKTVKYDSYGSSSVEYNLQLSEDGDPSMNVMTPL
jgi:hypothetical protein